MGRAVVRTLSGPTCFSDDRLNTTPRAALVSGMPVSERNRTHKKASITCTKFGTYRTEVLPLPHMRRAGKIFCDKSREVCDAIGVLAQKSEFSELLEIG